MKFKFLPILFLSLLFIGKSFAQVTVTSRDTVNCANPCTELYAHVIGDNPVNSGISIDDQYPITPLPIGFTFNFYGLNYTKCLIGPNGTICFDTTLADMFDDWTISGPLAGDPTLFNSVCGPYCDIDIVYGGSITYSTDGFAPNRKFVVTFCSTHMFDCTDQFTTTQMILYETTNVVEVHVAHKTICADWNGGYAIIGVQNATGTASIAAPGRDYPSVYTCTDEAWRFSPMDTAAIPTPDSTFYVVTSIGYAPVPYAINPDSIYWYNGNTGAYISTGDSIAVCPGGSTLYKAGKKGCADTSFGFYFVASNPLTVADIASNPSICGGRDGSIILNGLLPGTADTISYSYNSGPDTIFVVVVSPAGTITLSGLPSGVYSNITVKQLVCTATPFSVGLSNPPIAITSVDINEPTQCYLSDGSLVLNGLYSNTIYTINYDSAGIAQPTLVLPSNGTGSVTIPNLGVGTFSNIRAAITSSIDSCITPPMGPYTLVAPPPAPGNITGTIHPSQCGFSDGAITLGLFTPYTTDTINYTYNGIVQPSFIASTGTDGTIFLPGLHGGVYSGITVTIGQCVYAINGLATLDSPIIKANFDTSVHLGCHGDTVFFYNSSSSYFGGAAVDPGPLYYIWTYSDGTSTDTSSNPYHVFNTQGNYTVTLVADDHKCWDTISIPITLYHPLFDSFTASTYIVCQDSNIVFTNSSYGTPGKPIFYAWSFGDGTTDTATNPMHSYSLSGSYPVTLIAHDYVPCYDTFSAIVQSDTLSGIQILATDTVICQGTVITFSGLYSSLGNTGVTWYLGNGDSIKDVNPFTYAYSAAGDYVLTSTAYYRACLDVTTTRNIVVIPQPLLNLGPDTAICAGGTPITIADGNNAGNPAASWLWSTGETTAAITVNAPGYYFLTVDVHNCFASDTVWVSNDCYMNVPNVFTPNGDGNNDYFYPAQYLTKGVTSIKIEIYNRWGENIYEGTSLDGRGWDGKLNNVDQPEGVYIYVIDAIFKDGQREHHQGNVTLLR